MPSLTYSLKNNKICRVTGETSLQGGAPKGQIPNHRDETLRQKDCNSTKSWKALAFRFCSGSDTDGENP